MTPEDIARRRDAKRYNERLKLLSTFLNNVGIAIMAGAVIVPWATAAQAHALWIPAALGLHVAAQINLMFLKSEDRALSDWLAFGVPAGALGLAVIGLLASWLQSRAFDRRHPAPQRSAGE